jgi:hypothetical protein
MGLIWRRESFAYAVASRVGIFLGICPAARTCGVSGEMRHPLFSQPLIPLLLPSGRDRGRSGGIVGELEVEAGK